MAEIYRGFTLNVKGDPSWADRENAFHKAIIDKLLDEYIPLSQKASANGVATLDGFIKIPVDQLPDSILGAISYKGVWNATTNTPILGNSGAGGVKGDYYIVSVTGSTSIDGITDWTITDWIVNNGIKWDKIDNTDIIISVNSKTGVVVINPDDLDDTLTTHKFVTQGQIDLFHTHSNKSELDLVTDGNHDVRTDNPHAVTKAQVGLTNVPDLDTTTAVNSAHTHANKRITFANTPYTILVTDRKLLINTDGGNVVANLPAGSTNEDHRIINVGNSNKIVTLNPNGSEKLFGENVGFVLYDGESLDIAFDSTEGWY